MEQFGNITLDENIIKALKKQGIEKPTKIQEDCFAKILEGKHVIAQSQTGSGKTLAYLVPLFEKYKGIESGNRVIILVPTQELTLQVHRQIKLLAENAGLSIKSAAVFGNVRIERQIEALKEKPVFIVGTAARIEELIKKKKIAAHLVETIVLDEADKLLDKKVVDQQKMVCKCCMRDTQKLFFSASMPKAAVEEAQNIAPGAEVVQSVEETKIPKTISHAYLVIKKNGRIEALRKLLSRMKDKKVIIFMNGSYEIQEATAKMQYHHYSIASIYGESTKEERKQAIEGFRTGKIKYLIATDIAARGLHFDGVDAVVHVTLPQKPQEYQHRAGRCGRNGRKGLSISLITENELQHIHKLEASLKIKMEPYSLKEENVTQENVKPGKVKQGKGKETTKKVLPKDGKKRFEKKSSGKKDLGKKKELLKEKKEDSGKQGTKKQSK